jgi:hypothetical protein
VANRILGRLGGELLCTVAEASELPDWRARDLLKITEDQIHVLSKAKKGYPG